MKLVLLILLLAFLPGSIHSQETSIVNIGTNFPLFYPRNLGPNYVSVKSKPGLYFEMPIRINAFKIRALTINPGIAYFNTNESESEGRSSHYTSKDFEHQSYSCYLKVTKMNSIKNASFNWYFGAFSGFHLYSESKGENYWKVYSFGDYPSYSGNETISKKGKSDFYKSVYSGILIGIEPDLRNIKWFHPGLEFKLLPYFAKVSKDNYKSNLGGFEFTLNLGLGTKKAAQE